MSSLKNTNSIIVASAFVYIPTRSTIPPTPPPPSHSQHKHDAFLQISFFFHLTTHFLKWIIRVLLRLKSIQNLSAFHTYTQYACLASDISFMNKHLMCINAYKPHELEAIWMLCYELIIIKLMCINQHSMRIQHGLFIWNNKQYATNIRIFDVIQLIRHDRTYFKVKFILLYSVHRKNVPPSFNINFANAFMYARTNARARVYVQPMSYRKF